MIAVHLQSKLFFYYTSFYYYFPAKFVAFIVYSIIDIPSKQVNISVNFAVACVASVSVQFGSKELQGDKSGSKELQGDKWRD